MNHDMHRESDLGPPRVPAAAALGAVAAVLAALVVWTRSGDHAPGPDIAVGALTCLLAPVLVWRPVAGALVLTAVAALSPVGTPAATMAVLQVARRRPFPVAVAVAAAGVAAHTVQGLRQPAGGISFRWWLLLIALAYASLVGWGALNQARHALLVSLRERARRAEAEQGRLVAEARMAERTQLAREMHDVLAHRLSLLATYAGALEYRPDVSPDKLSQAAGVIREGAHQALEELRDVIVLLRDDGADGDDALEGRPQPVFTDVPRLVEESRQVGADVRVRDDVADPAALPAALGRAAYRVVQEALTNARKHAAGQPVELVLEGRPGTRLVIDVRNPLRGPNAAPPPPGTGTGLVGLTERVRLAGGRLDHEATEAGGFHLRASLPWPKDRSG